MTRHLILKVLVSAGAMLLTWMITTSILAHFKHEQPSKSSPEVVASSKEVADRDVVASSKKVVDTDPIEYEKAKNSSFLQSPPQADSQWLKSFHANAQGHILNVDAEVEINDRRRDKCYVWTLYVLKAIDDSAQLVHVYDNQVFTIPDSGNMSPTFHEQTELPSGTYKVILTLSRLPKDADLSTLKDPGVLKLPLSLRGFQVVTID